MKKILITAKNSYIGNSFAEWVGDRYEIDFISCRTDDWKTMSFAMYDVIYHVAGIAHIKETKKNRELYYKVNLGLTIELASKAKLEGVKQFIFLSSMSVYGMETGVISTDTPILPKSSYGKSKLQAEEQIKLLEDENFRIAIIRPPMVYGRDCKGNYQKLAKLALMLPVFPAVNNERSMIYIDHLSQLTKILIDSSSKGLYLPQNEDYVSSSDMVKTIAKVHSKRVHMNRALGLVVSCIKINIVLKVFGSLIYDKRISNFHLSYCQYNLKDSISLTEGV